MSLSGPWPASSATLSYTLPAGSSESWTLPGRRAAVVGTADAGLLHAWIHPFQVMQDVTLRVDGAERIPVSLSVTPEQVMRSSLANGAAVMERWTVALEHPIIVWQVEAPEGAGIALEWRVDLHDTAAPECVPAADRCGAVFRWSGHPFRLIVEVEGGTLASTAEGVAVRVAVQAKGACRVRLSGAADEADLERSRQMLARRGFAGILRQRADHAAELASYATSIATPDPTLVESFEWAKVHLDGLLTGTPGVGRFLASGRVERGGEATRFVTEDACRVAFAQLAAGDRTGPRDTLKFLSLSQDDSGRVVEECTTAGEARFGTGAVPMYLLLAARYAAWTGELDFLARRWAAVRRAFEVGIADRPWGGDPSAASSWFAALVELQPLAEALGHPEVAEHLAVVADEARAAAGPATFLPEPAGLPEFRAGRFEPGLDAWRAAAAGLLRTRSVAAAMACTTLAVEGLWGVQPGALDGGIRLAPWFPPDWESMSIERIRVARTVLSVRMRRRFGQVAARVERVHGPRMHVEFALRGEPALATVQLDEVELGGGRAAFEADATHALVWHR